MANTNETLVGAKVRDGHRATLFGVLGPERMVPIRSAGTRFYMEGSFPYRRLVLAASDYALGTKTADQIAHEVNADMVGPTRVTIAETADSLTRRQALALMGGAYHEAFHRLWSGQGRITGVEVERVFKAAGIRPGTNYKAHIQILMDLQNILEDIRIERLGCRVFPGVHTKLADLADFVLEAEAPVREQGLGKPNVAQIALSVLREVGLGYNTVKVREAMDHYRKVAPHAVAMTLRGPLTPTLRAVCVDLTTDAAVKASAEDVGLSTILAFQALHAIMDASEAQPQPPQPGQQPGQQPPQPGTPGQPSDGDDEDGEDGEGGPSTGSDDSDDESDDESDGGSADESDDESDESDSGGDSGSDDSDSDSGDEGSGGDGDDSDDSDGEPEVNDAESGTGGSGGNGSGGGAASPETAGDFLKDSTKGAGLKDYASALSDDVGEDRKEEDKEASANGERPYRPYSTSGDREIKVENPSAGQSRKLDSLAAGVKSETAFLKAKLRTMFRAMEDGAREHGLKRGPMLSERFLVDTVAAIRSGRDPNRAFAADDVTLDTSVAAVTVIDQSGSMSDKLEGAAKIALALGEALDAIGAKSAVTGFTTNGNSAIYQSGDYNAAWEDVRAMGAHRTDGVDIDVFKGFDERWRAAAPRLAKLRCSGGTPMADSIEHALRLLTNRREGYRIIFVLTDGVPDGGHAAVMKSQFRRAAEAGVMIVGVGLGRDSKYVTTTFTHSVYAEKLADIPRPLVAKLHEMVIGGAGNRRGRKVAAA